MCNKKIYVLGIEKIGLFDYRQILWILYLFPKEHYKTTDAKRKETIFHCCTK